MDVSDLIRKGKISRLFRARNKISFPDAICHITQHAAGKEKLFSEDSDYLYMLHLLKAVAEKYKIDIFSFAFLPNHLHILLQLSDDNLSLAMKSLFESYAKFYNNKYNRKGHLFCGSFRQALCFSDSYLLAISLYIHINAVKARLVNRPEDYRWSSCALYSSAFNKKTFVNYKFILESLDEDLANARKIYSALLRSSEKVKTEEVRVDIRALESFKTRAMEFFPALVKRTGRDAPGFLEDEKLEEAVLQLRQMGRLSTPESFTARKNLIEQLKARGYTIKVIGQMLGISRQAIYKTLKLTNSAMHKM